jgi:proteic killer suppression protein
LYRKFSVQKFDVAGQLELVIVVEAKKRFHRESVRRFKAIERQALRKLGMPDAVQDIRTLSTLPGNRLERLTGDRKGQYSIRVKDRWRVCFEWRDGHAYEVEIVDYQWETTG